jgi:hypothetical protein
MDLPFLVSLGWLLGMGCASLCVAQPLSNRLDALWLAGGFAAALVTTLWIPAQAAWVIALAGLAAAWQVMRPPRVAHSFAIAGVLGGLAAALYAGHGSPLWASALGSAAFLVFVVLLSRGRGIAKSSLRLGAFLMLAWICPLAAAAPGVIDGWRSAQALNIAAAKAGGDLPFWAFGFAGLMLAAGLLHGFLVRK